MIRVIAFDVYGTILATDDHDDCFPPRRGLEILLDRCEERGIIPVTSSDAYIPNMKCDLSATFSRFSERRLSVERFKEFFRLDQIGGKDYSLIIGHYDLVPDELLVIDDRECHIVSALRLGCLAIHCPEYRIDNGKEWDFSKINLD